MTGFLFRFALALLTAVLPTTGHPSPEGNHVWPLQPRPPVVHDFDAPPQPWAAGHRGVDLLGQTGQVVHASGAGTVTFSGVIAGVGIVSVTESNGWRTTYQPVTDRVDEGTSVAPGDRIGRLGGTGSHCRTRACLHWGWLVAPDTYRDPLDLLTHRRPVLLPPT